MTKAYWVLIGTGLAGFMLGVDYSIVNACLPNIQSALKMPLSQLQWLIGGFGITFGSLLVAMGRLADIVGRRKIFFLGLIGFALSSILAGFANSTSILIIARFLQGGFGAAMFPPGMAIVADAFPSQTRTRALAIYGALLGIGLALGPAIGGGLTACAGWRWIFFINVPVVIASLAICGFSVHESSDPNATAVDYMGMILCILLLLPLIFAINEGSTYGWSSPLIVTCFVITAIAGCILWVVEHRIASPLLDLQLFNNKSFILALCIFIVSTSLTWPIIFLMPMYLQIVCQYSVATSGLILLMMTGMTAIAPIPASAWFDLRSRTQIYYATFFLMMLALVLFCFLTMGGPLWLITISFILCGSAWGIGNAIPIPIALLGQDNTDAAGSITGTLLTLMNTCAVILLPIITTVFRTQSEKSFAQLIQDHNLSLSAQQAQQVHQMVADPEHLTRYLVNMPTSMMIQITHLFRLAFVTGLHRAFLVLIALCLILGLLVYTIQRRYSLDTPTYLKPVE